MITPSDECRDDYSALVQVMAWCRQATSHYLSQCWHSFISPYISCRYIYVVIMPQWETSYPSMGCTTQLRIKSIISLRYSSIDSPLRMGIHFAKVNVLCASTASSSSSSSKYFYSRKYITYAITEWRLKPVRVYMSRHSCSFHFIQNKPLLWQHRLVGGCGRGKKYKTKYK